jgi:L-glutamine-phosphate cytidylyltransferase
MGRLMAQLVSIGVTEVVCVVGYRGEMVQEYIEGLPEHPKVTYVENDRYADTNSIYSLYLSFPYWSDPVAIVDSDILVSTRLLTMLINGADTAMVIDAERSPQEIDMAVEVRDGTVWHLDKELPHDRVTGEFFGLSRWSGTTARALRDTIGEMVGEGDTGVWYQFAIRKVAKSAAIRPLHAHRDEWTEVDSAADLDAAEDQSRNAMWGRVA